MGTAFSMMKSIFTLSKPALSTSFIFNNFTRTDFAFLILSIIVLIAVSLLQRKRNLRETLSKQNIVFRWSIYCTAALSVIFLGVLASNDPSQFIYFQF